MSGIVFRLYIGVSLHDIFKSITISLSGVVIDFFPNLHFFSPPLFCKLSRNGHVTVR